MRRKISSAFTCMYSCNGYVPFHSACSHRICSVRINTCKGSSAQNLKANTCRGCRRCFWYSTVTATAFWEPGSPVRHLTGLFLQCKFSPGVWMWDWSLLCIDSMIMITKTMQCIYVCMCIIMQFRTHTLQSFCRALAIWLGVNIPVTEMHLVLVPLFLSLKKWFSSLRMGRLPVSPVACCYPKVLYLMWDSREVEKKGNLGNNSFKLFLGSMGLNCNFDVSL